MEKIKNKSKLISLAKHTYESAEYNHNFSHIKRVVRNCKKIHKKDGGDWEIIFISALFHDVHRVLQSKTKKYLSSQAAMPEVERIFENNKNIFPAEKVERILYNILKHDKKSMKIEDCNIELAILQDADSFDSIGRIGLKRTKNYCRINKIPFFSPIPLDDPEYAANTNPISTSHYVYRSLLPRYDAFRTEYAKQNFKKEKEILIKFIETERKKYCRKQKKEALD